MESIRTVFQDECRHLTVDGKLARAIALFQTNFRTKNEEHIAFFGGKLLGVEVVRFLPGDRDRWFDEILDVDEAPLADRLKALPTVNANFKISSDAFNLSCAYLLHAFWTSKMDEKEKVEAMINVALVLHYKYLTSILYNFFKYPADRATAEATYARLSYKFLIKNFDSWYALLRNLSERLVQHGSLHWRAISVMDIDKNVVDMLNDLQGRLRDMVKNIYAEFMNVHKQGIKISTSSSVVEFDGVETLKDKTRGLSTYTRYIQSVIPDKPSFVREELLSIIERLMGTMSPRYFRQSLEWMSDNYGQARTGLIDEVVQETLIHSFSFLSENTNLVKNTHDLPGILSRLRGTYMSSRTTDPVLLSLREKAEKLVTLATGNKNSNTIGPVRTGVLLYICLRTYTMHHYAQARV